VFISALISAYFNDPNAYFVVLAFPDVGISYTGKSKLGDDDFLAQKMGVQAAARIRHAVARLQPNLLGNQKISPNG
jgi:hypothetical protein